MDKLIRYILRESPDCASYRAEVETGGLGPEAVRELKRNAPWFTSQLALLSSQAVLYVNQNYNDGHMLCQSASPLKAVERQPGADISLCLHDAAIEFLNSKKSTFDSNITFEVLDQTRYSPGKRLESQVAQ